jgi:hypothetical protein
LAREEVSNGRIAPQHLGNRYFAYPQAEASPTAREPSTTNHLSSTKRQKNWSKHRPDQFPPRTLHMKKSASVPKVRKCFHEIFI